MRIDKQDNVSAVHLVPFRVLSVSVALSVIAVLCVERTDVSGYNLYPLSLWDSLILCHELIDCSNDAELYD